MQLRREPFGPVDWQGVQAYDQFPDGRIAGSGRLDGGFVTTGECIRMRRGMVCVAILGAICLCLAGVSPAHGLEAGAAKVELVAEPGTPLDGYLDRGGRGGTEIHDTLHVRALYLEEKGVAIFLASADLFAISRDLRERVLELAPPVVPEDNVILVATHTFSGPGGLDRSWLARQRSGRFMPEWLETVAQQFAEAMRTAYENRMRGAIGYATTQQRALNENRYDPEGPTDPQIGVVRVDDSDGNPIAMLANFGAAAQTAPGSAPLTFSADFPGAFCRSLEGMSSDGMVAFFLNGGAADQVCANPEGAGGWSWPARMGESLALRVKSLANDISCRELELRFASNREPLAASTAAHFLGEDALIQVLEIERCVLAFVPGVPDSATTLALRDAAQRRGYLRHFTVSAANGYIGGIRGAGSYALRRDDGDPVYVGPDAQPWLVSAFEGVLTRGDAAEVARDDVEASRVRSEAGIVHLALEGDAGHRGAVRGSVLRDAEARAGHLYGAWLRRHPATSRIAHWRLLEPATAVEALAVPLAGDASRPLLAALPESALGELIGMSRSSQRPFLEIWLRQLAPGVDASGARTGPMGVLFGMTGGDGEPLLVGHTLEWPSFAGPAVAEVNPADGIEYTGVSFPWQVGVVAGVNASGLAAAVAPSSSIADPDTLPPDLLLGELLARANDLDQAIAWLQEPRPAISGRVLIAGASASGPHFAIVQLGAAPLVTLLERDRVVVMPDLTNPDEAVKHVRAESLLNGIRRPAVESFTRILTDHERRTEARGHILNPTTRACVILDPGNATVHVMAPEHGQPRAFQVVRLGGGES